MRKKKSIINPSATHNELGRTFKFTLYGTRPSSTSTHSSFSQHRVAWVARCWWREWTQWLLQGGWGGLNRKAGRPAPICQKRPPLTFRNKPPPPLFHCWLLKRKKKKASSSLVLWAPLSLRDEWLLPLRTASHLTLVISKAQFDLPPRREWLRCAPKATKQ